MSLIRALAIMGAGMGGYARGRQMHEEGERRKADDAFRAEQQQWMRDERQRTASMRDSVARAAAPREVDASPVAVPIGSRDVPRAPEDQGMRVDGVTFTSMADATKAAEAANTPYARTMRMSDAYLSHGDPVAAQSLRSGALQERSGQLAFDEAQRKHINQLFDDALTPLASHDEVAQFVSSARGDGQGGAMQVKAVPSASGKVSYVQVMPDGTEKPTGLEFEGGARGVQEAKLWLSKNVSLQNKLTNAHQRWQEQQAVEQATRQQANADRDFGLRRDSLEETKRYHAGSLANDAARTRIAAAAAERAAKAEQGLTLADLKDGHKAIAATLNADYKAQLDDPAGKPEDRAGVKAKREQETVLAQRIFTGAAMHGIPLTPEQAIHALRTGQTGTIQVPAKDGSGMVTVPVVNVGGRVIPMADDAGFAPPPAPKPTPKPTPVRATAPAAGAAGAPSTTAAPPGEPGPVRRLLTRMSDLGVDYTSPEGKARLQQRVAEAGAGGAPLTEVETLRARQAGLI